MTEKKKTVQRILSGILFAAILLCIILVLGRIVCTDMLWSSFYETDRNSVDVIMLGASGISYYYQQAQAYGEQGFTSFVMASAGQPAELITTVMDEAMRYQRPKLLVVELRSIAGIADRNEKAETEEGREEVFLAPTENLLSMMAPFSPARWKGITRFAASASPSYFIKCAFPLMTCHARIYEIMRGNKDELYRGGWDNYFGSAIMSSTTDYTELGKTQSALRADDISRLDEHGKAVIEEIAARAAEYDVPLLFLFTPYLQDNFMYSMQEEIKAYLDERGYGYLDCAAYLDEIGLDYSSDFYDKRHVNVIGARKFTSWFAQYLNDNYDFSVERAQAISDKWSKLAADWEKLYPEYQKAARHELYIEDPITGELIPQF